MKPVLHAKAQRTFTAWGEGAEISLLRSHETGGVTTIARFFAGSSGKWHSHPGGEELYVISGRLRVGDIELSAGDYLFTPPGAAHEVFAHEEAVLLLVLPQMPDYSADPSGLQQPSGSA
jgi:quercetin dioxygenase-like cupin family protein